MWKFCISPLMKRNSCWRASPSPEHDRRPETNVIEKTLVACQPSCQYRATQSASQKKKVKHLIRSWGQQFDSKVDGLALKQDHILI